MSEEDGISREGSGEPTSRGNQRLCVGGLGVMLLVLFMRFGGVYFCNHRCCPVLYRFGEGISPFFFLVIY